MRYRQRTAQSGGELVCHVASPARKHPSAQAEVMVCVTRGGTVSVNWAVMLLATSYW